MTPLKNHKNTIIAILALLTLIALIAYAIYTDLASPSFDDIINNPTFTGTVAGKEVTVERFTTLGPRFTVHRLHIIGSYIEDGEKIQVDRVFAVPSEIYRQFEIGDIISHDIE